MESGDSRESFEGRGAGGKVDSVTIVDEGDFSKTFLTTMEVYAEEEIASVEVKGRR